MNNKRRLFTALNILLPLIAGVMVYIFVQKNTHLENILIEFFAVDFKPLIWSGWTYTFTICWLCDILWSYSLTFSLWAVLRPWKNAVLISAGLAFVAGAAFELLQLFEVMSGTFDVFDMALELMAAFLAAVVIKRRKYI